MLGTEHIHQPSPRTLRQFAGLWLLVFAGLALGRLATGDDGPLAWVLLALALTVGPLGLLKPGAVRPIFVGWMWAVYPLGWVVSQVLLACLFYGLFTPVGLFFRCVGRDVLARRFRPGQESYWEPKPATEEPGGYFRPF
jgi:hypothetical protein